MNLTRESERLLIAIFILVSIGLVMTYSASSMYAFRSFEDAAHFLKRQLLFVGVGLLVLSVVMRIRPEAIRRNSRKLILISIILLLIIFIPVIGKSGGGAKRWIRFFAFSVQPAEFVKIAVCIYLSDYLARKSRKIAQGSLKVFVPPLIVVGLVCGLILMQPDMGSVLIILTLTTILFFLAGLKIKHILISVGVTLPLVIGIILSAPYRVRRLVSYLNPWDDPQGAGYQIIQSFLAFALGGVKGVGLGGSTQKLFYLPQSYNDFIFSIIGEELGFIGVMSVLGLMAFVLMQGHRIARKQSGYDPFKRFFAYSMTLLIALQAVLNLMVATGLVPTKGLPLPFVSYGGSSLILNFTAIGLLVGVDSCRDRWTST